MLWPALSRYSTILFDCDGVILDSNRIKTQAFFNTAKVYGVDAAEALVRYHKQNGGVSRHLKFKHFVEDILGWKPDQYKVDQLVAHYAAEVHTQLMDCTVASGLAELRDKTRNARWALVSGGAQDELRAIFDSRQLSGYFDAGIHGSPDSKDTIFARLISEGVIRAPAVYLGDSQYDHEAASRAGLEFIFVSAWSEFEVLDAYRLDQNITSVATLSDFLR